MDFLSDDIQNGLLKNKRVGMIRRTLKRIGGEDINEFVFLPMVKKFIVLNVTDRFKIKDLKGGINKNE